jgi:hypothetical protein
MPVSHHGAPRSAEVGEDAQKQNRQPLLLQDAAGCSPTLNYPIYTANVFVSYEGSLVLDIHPKIKRTEYMEHERCADHIPEPKDKTDTSLVSVIHR